MLQDAADSKKATDMEALFSQLTLDVIGKAVFNYDFDALNHNSPIIQAGPDNRNINQLEALTISQQQATYSHASNQKKESHAMGS